MEWNEDETAQFELENIEAEKLTSYISPRNEKVKLNGTGAYWEFLRDRYGNVVHKIEHYGTVVSLIKEQSTDLLDSKLIEIILKFLNIFWIEWNEN